MGKFLFVGSKGGAGRTKSSLLFAAGMTMLELRPLHIQVLTDGRLPALQDVSGVPFARVALAVDEDALVMDSIRRHAAQHPMCRPVVVDMPAEGIRSEVVTDPGARILLPMRGAPLRSSMPHKTSVMRRSRGRGRRGSGLGRSHGIQ